MYRHQPQGLIWFCLCMFFFSQSRECPWGKQININFNFWVNYPFNIAIQIAFTCLPKVSKQFFVFYVKKYFKLFKVHNRVSFLSVAFWIHVNIDLQWKEVHTCTAALLSAGERYVDWRCPKKACPPSGSGMCSPNQKDWQRPLFVWMLCASR